MSKVYILKKNIQSPLGTSVAGTQSIEEGDFYAFPYVGKSRTDQNGWLGNGFMIMKSAIDEFKDEWFAEVVGYGAIKRFIIDTTEMTKEQLEYLGKALDGVTYGKQIILIDNE